MNLKIFKLSMCVLVLLSGVLLSACNRIQDIGITDEMVPPSDTDIVPTLKVGVIRPYPLYPNFGEGAELALSEINQAGGVLGRQVEFVYREELTENVVQSATDLITQEKVVAILGPLFSSHAVKVGPVATVPVLPGATGANVTDTGDFLFLAASSNVLQAKLMAQFAVSELGAKTAAMIWQNEDVYSIGFIKAFDANFQELGGSILAKETYEKDDTTFETQLIAIREADPDVLFLASFPPENPLIMKQARDMGIESIFIGSDGMDDSLMFKVLEDNTSLENTYYCTHFDPDKVEFISAYETMFETPANGMAASGYDAMKILAIALQAAESTDPVVIRDAIAAITDYEGATSISYFDENRHPVKSINVFQISDGQRKAYPTKIAPEISKSE